MAYIQIRTFPALLCQGIFFGIAESFLLFTFRKDTEFRFPDISQAMIRIHIMVAAVNRTVFFNDQYIAAGFRKPAYIRFLSG